MRRVFAIIASCIALAACERSFDISKQVGESTLWMTFIPSNDYDTTYFILQATTPLVGTTNPVRTSGESVEVRVNGQTLRMDKSDRSVPDRMQFYATDHVFVPGDRVEVAATVPGTGSADASCVVPEPFPAFSWTAWLVRRSEGGQAIFVDIDYSDPAEGAGYYGAAVCQYTEQDSQWLETDPETGESHLGETIHSSHTGFLSPCPMSDAEGLSAASENPVTVIPSYYNTLSSNGSRQSVQIWSDVSTPALADGRRRMTFASVCYEQPSGRREYSRGWSESRYKYRLVLYRFSESYYNYLKARYNNNSDEFSSMGLAPASFVYTNVRGGAGVCGAYTVISSDWIELDRTN